MSVCLYLLVSWSSEQASLRQQVLEEDTEDWQRELDFSGLERVGGVDLSFIKGDNVNACAQLVVLSYPNLEVSHHVTALRNDRWSKERVNFVDL